MYQENMMIKSKKHSKEITGEEDFPTFEEYRTYLISSLTSLRQQSPGFEQEEDVLMPEQKQETPTVQDQTTRFVETEHKIRQELIRDAGEFQYKKFWLLNDSPGPSVLELGLQNHPDAERPNYYPRQMVSKRLVKNYSSFETAMVDGFFNKQECKKAMCDPGDQVVLLFPDISKSEEFDDITTMKYLIRYKVNFGALPFSVNQPEPTQSQLDCVHAYIQAILTPWGRHISGPGLRSKIYKLHDKYKNLVEGKGDDEKPDAQGVSTHVRKLVADLLKMTWEQDRSRSYVVVKKETD